MLRHAIIWSGGRLPFTACAIWLMLLPMRRSSVNSAGSINL